MRLQGVLVLVPHFLDWGTMIPRTFQDSGEEFAVIRRNLWRLNYTKTIFGQGSAADPAREFMFRLGWPRARPSTSWLPVSLNQNYETVLRTAGDN